MRIPVGRIIKADMGDEKWGRVLYLVVNPPIVCETCCSVVFEWRESAGDVICPDCGSVIRSREHPPCPVCGEDDYHTLRVVHNNNWHYDSVSGEVTEYNDKRGVSMSRCGKSIMDDIRPQRVVLLTARESQDMKRRITWVGSDDYAPGRPMPQWIIDKFPYGAQE